MYKTYINLNKKENLSSPAHSHSHKMVAPPISLTYPVSPFYFLHDTDRHLTYHIVCVGNLNSKINPSESHPSIRPYSCIQTGPVTFLLDNRVWQR